MGFVNYDKGIKNMQEAVRLAHSHGNFSGGSMPAGAVPYPPPMSGTSSPVYPPPPGYPNAPQPPPPGYPPAAKPGYPPA